MVGFVLPPVGSVAREAIGGDASRIAVVLDPRNIGRLPETREAVKNGAATCQRTGCRFVYAVVLRGDDERWLIRVGPRGGWRKMWNFGTGR